MKSSTILKLLSFVLLLTFFYGCDNTVNINDSNNDHTIHGSGKIVSQSKIVSECSGIKVTNVGDIYLTQNSNQSIRIEADDNILRHVILEERNGILYVGLEEGSYSDITLKVYVSLKTIENLSIEGAGKITAQNSLVCDQLTCTITGAGNIYLKGRVDYFSCSLTGAGKINAEEFASKKCTAIVNGAGNCTVNSSEELIASLSGVGSIIYYGNPKDVHTTIAGIGQIISR